MAMAGGKDDGAPMMEMNMTPLIDVLLVLLIVFIMSIPIATNAINIDLPQPSPPTENNIEPDINKIVLTQNGQILWNGDTITQGQLVGNLQETLRFPVEPELQFEPEANASYNLAANTLQIIKASGVTKFGFVSNEQYRQFGSS